MKSMVAPTPPCGVGRCELKLSTTTRHQPGQRPRGLPFSRRTVSPLPEEKEGNDFLKMKERRGNVIENKGPAFCGPGQSGNLIENTGSYALNPVISLKTSMLAGSLEAICAKVVETGQPYATLPVASVCGFCRAST